MRAIPDAAAVSDNLQRLQALPYLYLLPVRALDSFDLAVRKEGINSLARLCVRRGRRRRTRKQKVESVFEGSFLSPHTRTRVRASFEIQQQEQEQQRLKLLLKLSKHFGQLSLVNISVYFVLLTMPLDTLHAEEWQGSCSLSDSRYLLLLSLTAGSKSRR